MKIRAALTRIRQYWLSVLFGTLCLLSAWGPVTVGAQATPTATPDVNTVPPVNLPTTPTAAPPPVQVPIVTATPVPAATGGNSNPSAEGESTDQAGDNTGNTAAEPNQVEDTTATASPTLSTSPAVSNTTAVTRGPQLVLSMLPNRAFVWQGEELQLTLAVHNAGQQPATGVALRSDLPAAFAVQPLVVDSSASVQTRPSAANNNLLVVTWPRLAAGATVTVTLPLVITPVTPNGSFIDTFAVVQAQDVADVVAGLTIVMPPAQLPQFR